MDHVPVDLYLAPLARASYIVGYLDCCNKAINSSSKATSNN